MNHHANLLSSVPGYIVLQDTQSRFLNANYSAAVELGFKNVDDMIGLLPGEVRCPAAEIQEEVIANNQFIMTHGCEVGIIFSVYSARDRWGLYLGRQQPLRDSAGLIKGVSTHTYEVTNTVLAPKLTTLFLKQKGRGKTKISQGVYKHVDNVQKWHLPPRQGECFFWLLQRKSAKEIAELLSLSRRTVESYIEIIKNKFQVKTLNELMDMAEQQGISNYIPQHWCSWGL